MLAHGTFALLGVAHSTFASLVRARHAVVKRSQTASDGGHSQLGRTFRQLDGGAPAARALLCGAAMFRCMQAYADVPMSLERAGKGSSSGRDVSVFQMGPVVKSRGALGIFLESSCKNSVGRQNCACRKAGRMGGDGGGVLCVVSCVY